MFRNHVKVEVLTLIRALLNLDLQKPKSYYYKYLKSNAYKDLKGNEFMLEIEAYANEKNHGQTLNIFNYFCLGN